jgi:hypothetical protein
VQDCWSQLNIWSAVDDLTQLDLIRMLQEAGAPECQPEQVAGLCGMLGRYVSARRRGLHRKRNREPLKRIEAACAELRRTIPKELEWLERELGAGDEAPMYVHEISRLKGLLLAATAECDFPYFFDEDDEVDPRKYDPQAIRKIFFSYEMIYGQSGISRNSPAVRFIAAIVKAVGWDPVGPGAIEQLLRRSLRARAPINTN